MKKIHIIETMAQIHKTVLSVIYQLEFTASACLGIQQVTHAKAVNSNYNNHCKRSCFAIASIILLFFITCSALLCGCSTPMMKSTPFYTGEVVYGVSSTGKMVKWDDPESSGIKRATLNDDLNRLEPDRINIWPLFYKNLLFYGIMWPIGEVNDVGWAFRPMVSVDNFNGSYKYLAYMGGYNSKEKSSYFIPVYYSDGSEFISPLICWNKDSVVLPALLTGWKYEKDGIRLNVLAMFSEFNTATGESYIFPIYGKEKDSFLSIPFSYSKKGMYIMPPLFAQKNIFSKEKDAADTVIGTDNYYLWPFSRFRTTDNSSYVFPIYSKSPTSLYSLLFGYNEKSMYIMPPLFFQKKVYSDGRDDPIKDGTVRYFLPPFSRFDSLNERSYVFPAYSTGKDYFYSLLFGYNQEMEYALPPFFIKKNLDPGMNEKTGQMEEGARYSYMWPFSMFDTRDKISYVFPFYASSEKSLYTLPFGHTDTMMYVMPPFYIRDNIVSKKDEKTGETVETSTSHFLWPFSKFNSANRSSYIFPLYKKDAFSFYSLLYGYDDKFLYIMPPPLFMMKKDLEGKGRNSYIIFGPLCCFQPSKNKYFSFPLFYYSDDKDKKEFQFYYLWPLGWCQENEQSAFSMFFPVYFSGTDKKAGTDYMFTPLFYAKNNFQKFFTPLFGWWNDGKSYYASPLLTKESSEDHTDYNFLLAMSKLRFMNNPEEGISSIQGHVLPFFFYYQDKNGYDLDIMFPLVARGISGQGRDKVEYSRYLPFYYDYSDSEYSHTNYTFFGRTRRKINDSNHDAWYLLPFYFSYWKEDWDYIAVKPEIDGKDIFNSSDRSDGNLGYKEITTARKNSFILPNILLSENKEKEISDFSVIPFYFRNRTKSKVNDSSFLWLFTRQEDTELKTVDSQAMWYLYYHSAQEKTETEKEASITRILWKFYHSEKLGDEFNVDIFPFISYTGNPKRNRFSFCWRLFSYEKSQESFKLNLFFIPVLW